MYGQQENQFYESLLESFKLYNPNDADVVSWYASGPMELTITMSDGEQVIYDHLERGIRIIRRTPEEDVLSEERWRAEFVFKVRHRMMRKGLTQKDLAEMSGVSLMSINKYLNMKSTPTAYTVMKIANALGCSSTELTDF